MALVGNLRLWTVQELVSSVLLCNHKSIQDETVRKVCENFQRLDMGIFVHILSGSDYMFSYTPLFTLLVQKGMTKTQLREAIGIGTGTLAKMSKGEYVSMEVLDKICTYLQCNIEDIVKHQP